MRVHLLFVTDMLKQEAASRMCCPPGNATLVCHINHTIHQRGSIHVAQFTT
jgi:hypothetical protein